LIAAAVAVLGSLALLIYLGAVAVADMGAAPGGRDLS
jgi:hypothetical protein